MYLKKFSKSMTGLVGLCLVGSSLALPSAALAQSAYGIAAVVNDDIVTSFDLQQRVLFMLATTGAERTEESLARIQAQALRNLVDEKIELQESKKYEQTISPQEVDQSVARLISRNGLDPQEVAQKLASAGISLNTMRNQVEAEIAWQRIVNGLYGSRIRISDAQIDETLNRLSANAAKPSFNVAEIYIEATPDIGGAEGAMEGANAMIKQVREGAPFQLLAQQFSSAPSSSNSGMIGWVREGELRPELDTALKAMEPKTVSEPIIVPGGVYVLALLDKRTSKSETLYKLKQVNYKAEEQAGKDAAKGKLLALKGKLSSCETLSADIEDYDGLNQADMGELKSSDMTDAILEKLAGADIGDLTDPIETPSGVAAVLVCDRTSTGSGIPTRNEIEDNLMSKQIAQASKRHLRDLRRKASIIVR